MERGVGQAYTAGWLDKDGVEAGGDKAGGIKEVDGWRQGGEDGVQGRRIGAGDEQGTAARGWRRLAARMGSKKGG